jgi:hypothetical protein
MMNAVDLCSPLVLRQTSIDGWVAHGFSRGGHGTAGEAQRKSARHLCPPPLKRWATRWLWLAGLVTLGFALGGCDSAPPAAARRPQTRPAAPATAPAEGAAVTTRPAEVRPAPQPAPVRPAPQPAEPQPPIPEYLTIVRRYDPGAAAQVQVTTVAGHRLVIETRNVQCLHIDRDTSPLDRSRSIALVLDGQGIEWLARSKVVEFERSPNGVWMPVKPRKP